VAKKERKKTTPRRVTLQDVANAAGVSLGAASAALRGTNRPIGVSPEKRERILRIARELNYRPHAAARAMAGHAFRTIGVLAAEYCFGSYYSRVLRAIVGQAEECGYNVIVKMASSTLDLQNARIFNEELIDGVIIPAEHESHLREALFQFVIPHVWLHAGVDEPYNCVIADEAHGLQLAVEHLRTLGHRRIAFMPHDEAPSATTHTVVNRRAGYLEAMHQAGLPPIMARQEFMPVPAAVEHFLSLSPRVTAIIAHTDALASLTCAALLNRGVRIPADISVVGNEGVVWHRYCNPPLTTVRAPVLELGHAAVDMLVQRIERREPVRSVRVPQQLEIGASTGPAPAD